jgi:hypothetical protein
MLFQTVSHCLDVNACRQAQFICVQQMLRRFLTFLPFKVQKTIFIPNFEIFPLFPTINSWF